QASYRQSPQSVLELLRVEDGAAVLAVSRPDGQLVAKVALASVEDASFFVEGLDDPPEEVEEWLTEINSFFSDRTRLSFKEALTALVSRAPASLGLVKNQASRESDREEPEMEDDEDTVFREVPSSSSEAQFEVNEDRKRQRSKGAEDAHWESMVSSSSSQGSRQASQVLMREMRSLMALQGGDGDSKALEIEMVEDSLYHWSVKMHARGFSSDCPLREELERFAASAPHSSGLAAVVMDVMFPDSYPMAPPFIRVVRPRFLLHTGHITIGGSVCMQLLTPSGWLPSVSLENVFVSIRSEMIEGGGRIDFANSSRDYSVAESKEAFKRVAQRYGWMNT
ncbi:unnamed protein product, partial [Polarella glacialis]